MASSKDTIIWNIPKENTILKQTYLEKMCSSDYTLRELSWTLPFLVRSLIKAYQLRVDIKAHLCLKFPIKSMKLREL